MKQTKNILSGLVIALNVVGVVCLIYSNFENRITWKLEESVKA